MYTQHHMMKLDSIKANSTVEHRLDNFLVPAMPWHPCTSLWYSC